MAEALAIVSVVASIVQLVDFSTRAVSRLNEFYSVANEVPKSFRHVKTELPLLATTLTQLKDAIETTSVADGATKALVPVIAGCTEQVEKLDIILKNVLPESNDSLRIKGKKAIVSLNADRKVESITGSLRNYVGILTFYYAATSSTLQPLTDAKLCKIRQWLSAPDPSTSYQKALKLRQADTGLWLLESEAYNEWKRSATTPLWLYGIPGCGKTILSSTVLQDVLQHCQDDPGKVTAYFFFDFNDAQKQDPEIMMRSLLCQLSEQAIKIPPSLDDLFSSCQSGQRQPSTDALMNALQLITQDFPQTYILLDALDECTQRGELMEMLETIVRWKVPNLHLVVTSRREHDIESSLVKFVDVQNQICLQSAIVNKDIQLYVRQRLSKDKRLQKWGKDTSTKAQIESVLMNGAKGMFRWAVCQLDELGKCVNRRMLQKALSGLPPDLDQTYERILASIDEDYFQYAFRILQWVAFSIRPLTMNEVAEVVAIDAKRDPPFDRDEVLEDPLEVLNICSSLVNVTDDNTFRSDYPDDPLPAWAQVPVQVVELAHYSVKEYLVSDRIGTGKAARYSMRDGVCHGAITDSCLGYLLQFQEPELKPDFLESFRLALYSAKFWPSHAQEAAQLTKATNKAMIRLFCKKEHAYINWIRLCDQSNPSRECNLSKYAEGIPEPLYYAALFGLIDVVKLLLDKGADVNAQIDGIGKGHALYAASSRGHKDIVELLLVKGAVICTSDYHDDPLIKAVECGYKEIVKLLLDTCYKDPITAHIHGLALLLASHEGYDAVVKVLLDRDTKGFIKDRHYGDALGSASGRGHKEVVRLLLDKGVTVPAIAKHYTTALKQALIYDQEEIVKLLLDRGNVTPEQVLQARARLESIHRQWY